MSGSCSWMKIYAVGDCLCGGGWFWPSVSVLRAVWSVARPNFCGGGQCGDLCWVRGAGGGEVCGGLRRVSGFRGPGW